MKTAVIALAVAATALAVDILFFSVGNLRNGIGDRLTEAPDAKEASGLAKADGILAGYADPPDTARRLKVLAKAGSAMDKSGTTSDLVLLPADALAGDALAVLGQGRAAAVTAVGALTVQKNIDKVWKAIGKYDPLQQAAEDARVVEEWGDCLGGVAKAYAGYAKARLLAEKLAAQEP